MKTPMQEVYENFNFLSDADFKAWMLNTDLLKKEKEVIEKAWWAGCDEGASDHKIYPSEDCNGYYNKTFKTKER